MLKNKDGSPYFFSFFVAYRILLISHLWDDDPYWCIGWIVEIALHDIDNLYCLI